MITYAMYVNVNNYQVRIQVTGDELIPNYYNIHNIIHDIGNLIACIQWEYKILIINLRTISNNMLSIFIRIINSIIGVISALLFVKYVS